MIAAALGPIFSVGWERLTWNSHQRSQARDSILRHRVDFLRAKLYNRFFIMNIQSIHNSLPHPWPWPSKHQPQNIVSNSGPTTCQIRTEFPYKAPSTIGMSSLPHPSQTDRSTLITLIRLLASLQQFS